MSYDIGILITKEKKRINLVEICLSSGYKKTIGHFKTAEEALAKIEEDDLSYEGIIVKGFI